METKKLVKVCKTALLEAHKTLTKIGAKGISEIKDDHVVDISTKGDMAISKNLINFFKKEKISAVLYSEESGRIVLGKNPKFTITFDDIDGTNNYYCGRNLLPYCTVVTIFDSTKPKFKDALIAGVIEHNSKKIWLAVRNKGCYLNDLKIKTSGTTNINRRTVVIIDHYASSNKISKLAKIYPKVWIKDFGSAALHLAGVSSGMFDAYISSANKAHELGAGYLLIKEAGGFITDWSGKLIDDKIYNFDNKYSVITASTEKLGKLLVSKI